ncbi:glycoside hydrolase family 38 C-terminal domain-containing protein [soil metagenome]
MTEVTSPRLATVAIVYDDAELIEERISRELIERVPPLVTLDTRPLDVMAGPDLDDLAPLRVGDQWGAPWTTTWFRCSGDVPAEWAGGRVEAMLDLGRGEDGPGFSWEALVRDPQGRASHGLHPRRHHVSLPGRAGPVDIVVEAASNPSVPGFAPSAMGDPATAGCAPQYTLGRAELVLVDPAADDLLVDLTALDGVMRTLPAKDPRRAQLRTVIVRALDALAARRPAVEVRRITAAALQRPAGASAHRVVGIGHAHIDTAWLWPIRETKRKCVRTFSSAVRLMDDDPDYRFGCSQAQQYEWVRELEPEVFAAIVDKVDTGQWVPLGGMWVESDMNLPSGESLVRQIVQGQRWFERHLGRRCTEMWIPDVFGYPATLPQIFAAGGMRRFVTQKLSWNRTNRFPHHTFWWEGLDGTRVLTHFPPVDTYNAEITPAEMAWSVERFSEHAWSNWSLMPFGHGDGGGGPTREMPATAHRLGDLDGMPRFEQASPAEFFGHVEAEIAAGAPVPVWRGELYFETHRGTLTSQLRTKLGNRRCERLLREAELWAATHAATDPDGAAADPHEFDELWQRVLTEQFHDILPGSSIAWVHDDAEVEFTAVAEELERRIAERLCQLAGGGPLLANVAGVSRDEIVLVDDVPETVSSGAPVQRLADGRSALRVRVPALGLSRFGPRNGRPDDDFADQDARHDRVVVTDRTMVNGLLAVSWDHEGHLSSVIDVVRGREMLPAGAPGATLELAVDRPVRFDAWDVESWTVDGGQVIGSPDDVTVEAAGPLVGIVAVRRTFGPSTATVRYVLRAGSSRLDVEVSLDWHHDEHLLSMRFPLDVRTDTASCGVQFGSVRRPTHRSTSWDAAKFEVCAHRYVDVAEPEFGVAVLNNGRYGHGLFDGGVRVSLARSARYPDPGSDHGRHDVTLALFPHGPGLSVVVAEAERLEFPIRVVAASDGARDGVDAPLPPPVVTVSGHGVEVDAVKLADDGSGDVVVRLHEATGNRRAVTVAMAARVTAASACNLLEEPDRGFEVSDGIVAFTLRPFELMTLRLRTRSLGEL